MSDVLDSYDPQHLEEFLSKIDADRVREVTRIATATAEERERIRRGAYAESIAFHRDQAERVRRREQTDRERALSRTHSEIRRRRWALLFDLEQRAREGLERRCAAAWGSPPGQLRWCSYWLRFARDAARGERLEVTLGNGASPETVRTLARVLAEWSPAGKVALDPEQSPGIVVSWRDRILDGRFRSHYDDLMVGVLAELAALLHGDTERAAP